MPGRKKSGVQNTPKRSAHVTAGAILPDLQYLQAIEKMASQRLSPHGSPAAAQSSAIQPEQLQTSDTATILQAITSSHNAMMARIDSMAADCGLIRADMDRVSHKQQEAEQRISAAEDLIHRYERTIGELQRRVKHLEDRAEDAEGRQRRGNVRILHLPEGAEGDRPEVFTEQLLKDSLGLQQVGPTFVVERAHRVPTGPPTPGAPPRPFILKMLNCKDRDNILQAARIKKKVHFGNAEIQFYPDFTNAVQKGRKSFQEVRSVLRNKGIKYNTVYPFKLKVYHADGIKWFNTPDAANAWIRTLGGPA